MAGRSSVVLPDKHHLDCRLGDMCYLLVLAILTLTHSDIDVHTIAHLSLLPR